MRPVLSLQNPQVGKRRALIIAAFYQPIELGKHDNRHVQLFGEDL